MPIKRPGTFLPDKILQSLIMAIDNPIYKAVSILRYHTGIRAFEALTLKEEMITEEELTIQTDKGPKQAQFTKMIIETKRGRNRPIYLKRSLAEAILGQYMTGMPGYLFMPRHYDIYDRRDIAIKLRTAISLYNDALAQAAKKIGLKQRFGTHDIRRAFAMRTKRQLKDLELVRRLMGHSKIDTTLRYFSQSNEDLIDAIAKMQRLT
jgi:integrase